VAARPAAKRLAPERVRVGLLGLVLLLAWAGLGARLFEVQVVRASEFAELGLGQRMTRKTLAPDRGTIFDRDGEPLAMTVEARTIYAVPALLADAVYATQMVSAYTGKPVEPMRNAIEKGGNFAYMARQIDPDIAQLVMDLGLPGVFMINEPKRVYPAASIASHVVGFVDIDGKGLEGLEFRYDLHLTGTPGEVEFERDVSGTPIPQGQLREIPAVPGDDVVTTIDLPLQFAAADACSRAMEASQAIGCWIVVLHAETGEILAMAGAPRFDPVTRQSADGSAFTNFAVRGMYEPGSTQKLVTMATALDTGTFRPADVITGVADQLEINAGACDESDDDIFGCYRDVNKHETINMTVQEIFTKSSNVGTIKMSQRLPAGSLVEYMERFGLGAPTGVDYSGEAAGAVRIDPGCTTCLASAAIGYSVAVTSLQMAAAFAAIANDGVWTQPYLTSATVDVNGRLSEFVPKTRRVVKAETAWTIRQLLSDVVLEGTGTAAQIPGYRVGGKTGTAEKLVNGVYTDQNMASFVGMAPIDDPKVVVAVLIDEPSYETRYGGISAAPAFAEVMEAALHRLGVAPSGTEQ